MKTLRTIAHNAYLKAATSDAADPWEAVADAVIEAGRQMVFEIARSADMIKTPADRAVIEAARRLAYGSTWVVDDGGMEMTIPAWDGHWMAKLEQKLRALDSEEK